MGAKIDLGAGGVNALWRSAARRLTPRAIAGNLPPRSAARGRRRHAPARGPEGGPDAEEEAEERRGEGARREEMSESALGSVEIRVRYAETDQMGRAHHSHFLAWCELGRISLMRERGVPYPDLERDGVLLPVTRAELEYRRGAGFDERVRVDTSVEWVRSRGVAFRYGVFRVEDGALLARIRTELVCTDRTGRPRRLPDDVRSALESAARASGGRRSGRDAAGRDS